jgi:hypothetical protein
MKTQLLFIIAGVTLMNTVAFSIMSGCGVFQSVPLAIAWQVVSVCSNSFFADNHSHLVVIVAAFFSACFLAGILGISVLIARKRRLLLSRSSVTTMCAIGFVIYLLLNLLRFPAGPCF